MSQPTGYVSKVLWVPQEKTDVNQSNQTTPYASTQKLATDEVRASAGVRADGSSQQQQQPYRITSVRLGDDREREQIEQDQVREANRARESKLSWNWAYTAWNVIACLLCPVCVYCMLGALLCNIFAYIDHRSRDFVGKRKKLRCALLWSVTFFAVGVVSVVIILVILFAVFNAQNWTSIPTIPGRDFTM